MAALRGNRQREMLVSATMSEATRRPHAEARRGIRNKKMTTDSRMIKLLAATPQVLAKIDAVLSGTDGRPDKADVDARLITYTEAARRLNLSRPTVYRLVKLRRLEVVPLDGVSRVRLQSVIDFANGTTRK